jgi:isopentenyldiphosphate isomerase
LIHFNANHKFKFYNKEIKKGVLKMEYLDVVDEQNNLTGQVEERDVIHAKGLWHREVAVWIMNEKNEVLLQRRAATKKQGANKWSVCAGHVDPGEEPVIAALREASEELGIQISKEELEELMVEKIARKHTNSMNNRFAYVYFYRTNTPIGDYHIQLEELSEVKYITLDELGKIIEEKPEDYPMAGNEYILRIYEKLKERAHI